MSKAAKTQTIIERWFPHKRYVLVIVAKKLCPLTYHQRLIYSYLVYRLRQDQTASTLKISKILRMEKKVVEQAAKALAVHNLVVEESGQYCAKEPTKDQENWFASNKRTDGAWHRQCATYPVLRPKKGSKISTKTNAILWLLYSLARKYGKPAVFSQNIAGLATLLNMSEKGVSQAIKRLEKEGLVERIGTTFLLKEPSQQVLELWETRPIQPTISFRPVYVNLTTDKNDPDYERYLDIAKDINERIDFFSRMMLKAGCPEQDINEYWRYIIKNCRDLDQLWEYTVSEFEGVFNYYSEQHRKNGYSGHPMKLLMMKVEEHFPEQNADAF